MTINYSMTSGIWWNYYSDEINDNANENDNSGKKINNDKTITNKSFKYKAKTIGRTSDDNNTLDTELVVSLKYLSNFWRFLDLCLMLNFMFQLLLCLEIIISNF